MTLSDYTYWYPLLKDHCPKSMILDAACIQALFVHCTSPGRTTIKISSRTPVDVTQQLESENEDERSTSTSENESETTSLHENQYDTYSSATTTRQAESYTGEFEAMALIETAIQSLGGSVFIKDNVQAPNDAGWISPCQSLACHSYNDTVTLLSASDKMIASRSSPPRSLICKQWIPFLDTAREYRLHISSKRLATLLPRQSMAHVSRQVVDRMKQFVEREICPKLEIHSYILDIYDDPRTGRILILDLSDQIASMHEIQREGLLNARSQHHSVALPLELKETSLAETIEKLASQQRKPLSSTRE